MTGLLSVAELILSRADIRLCRNWSMQLNEGECIHLMGANGSGKTSLLQALSGLLQPDGGSISWAPGGPEQLAHYCGHHEGLKGVWTVAENLRWQLALGGLDVESEQWRQLLSAMRLENLVDIPVSQLSQGQKRRAALMKLGLMPRAVWLLDEPFNALDPEGRRCLVQWINDHTSKGGAVLFTSHIEAPCALGVTRRIAMEGTA